MRKLLLATVIITLRAQTPIAVSQIGIDGLNTGNQIDYFATTTLGTPTGDTYYCTAWAANSMISFFPNASGLPITCTWNDGATAAPDPACSGNLGLVQLSKLPALGTPANSGNTLMTGYPCYSSYSAGGISTAPGGSWSDSLTWKTAPFTYILNVLRAMMFRQNNAGTQFGPSSSVISFDAGIHAIDFGRWQGYTVTAASCSGGSASVTLSSAASGGGETLVATNVVFVHNVGTGYDGQFTLTSVVGNVIHYATTCPGTTPSSGFVALAAADGSAPWGPGNAGGYNIQWPSSGSSNPMGLKAPIVYGQDGTWVSGIESICNPAVNICFISSDEAVGGAVIMGYYPSQCDATYCGEFDNSAYRWYHCTTLNGFFPSVGTCDFTQAANQTATLAQATPMLYTGPPSGGYGVWPGQRLGMTFLPAFHSYILSGVTRDQSGSGASKMSWWWGPHPWGPWILSGQSQCSEQSTTVLACGPGFTIPLLFQSTGASSNPPAMSLRYATDLFVNTSIHPGYSASGNPFFGQIDTVVGQAPIQGMARRAGPLVNLNNAGTISTLGMGHRFTSGQMFGAVSRSGLSTAFTPPTITGYSNCRLVTVGGGMVTGTLTNYPLLVSVTNADFKDTGHGGLVNSILGYDIGFGADCSGAGPLLFWDMESYDNVGGTVIAWVLKTSITNGDTVGIYYTGSQSTYQSTACNVWNSSYKGVYHLSSASNPIADSTCAANNMAPQNTPTNTSGQVDGAVNFVTASTQYATDASASVVTNFPITIEAWAQLASSTLVGDQVVASLSNHGALQEFWGGYINSAGNFFRLVVNGTGGPIIYQCPITPDTSPHHFVGIFTNISTFAVYEDGAAMAGCNAFGSSATPTGLTNTDIGGFVYNGSTNYGNFGGKLDEVRFLNIAQGSATISTEYKNMFSPGTYLTLGSRVTPGTPSTVSSNYKAVWWADLFDNGGDTHATSRPIFMDGLSQGLKNFSVYGFNGVNWVNTFGAGASLSASGVTVTGGAMIQSNFTDTDNIFTGNSSWSMVFVMNPTSGNRWMYLTPNAGQGGSYNPDLIIEPSGSNLCALWAGSTSVCTNTSPITISTWQMFVITASANTSGPPTMHFYYGAGGTVTDITGSDLTVTGSTTPALSSGDTYWFGTATTQFGAYVGTYGEIGAYTGVVPSSAAADIYKSVRADWARTGRCTVSAGVCTNF